MGRNPKLSSILILVSLFFLYLYSYSYTILILSSILIIMSLFLYPVSTLMNLFLYHILQQRQQRRLDGPEPKAIIYSYRYQYSYSIIIQSSILILMNLFLHPVSTLMNPFLYHVLQQRQRRLDGAQPKAIICSYPSILILLILVFLFICHHLFVCQYILLLILIDLFSSGSGDSMGRNPKLTKRTPSTSGNAVAPKYIWIRVALLEKCLPQIIDYLVENSRQAQHSGRNNLAGRNVIASTSGYAQRFWRSVCRRSSTLWWRTAGRQIE